jgi:peptide deformylase
VKQQEIKLQIAPKPIFRKRAMRVEHEDEEIKQLIESMFEIMYENEAVGIGANMVGILKRIIVVDLQEKRKSVPFAMINPIIVFKSKEMQKFEEGSISYPGIKAIVERPDEIRVEYTDCEGEAQIMEAEGWLATVIQHEIDYLDGKIFLDYVPTVIRKILLKKMEKHLKHNK